MIVYKIIYYHTNHLFPTLHKQVGAAIEYTFAAGLLLNDELIRE